MGGRRRAPLAANPRGNEQEPRIKIKKRLPAAKLTHGETVPYLDAFLL